MDISKKNIMAIVIGNALEWYDFTVYSFVTVFIAKLFFPAQDAMTAILATTAIFGVSFFMRPVGGILLGLVSDKKGRKTALTWIILLMTIALLMIAFAPTYAQVGIAAPMIILLARLLQGFSAGGEFGVSTALLYELAPPQRRGYYGSYQMVGQIVAAIIGGLLGLLMTECLSTAVLESWGWRIPFLFGLLIAPIGFYIRSHLNVPEVSSYSARNTIHARGLKYYIREILIGMGLVTGATTSIYITIHYIPTYTVKSLHLSMTASFTAVTISSALMVILIPLFGKLSDFIGRRKVAIASVASYLIVLYPLFSWLNDAPSFTKLLLVQMMLNTILAAYYGVFCTIITDLFPVHIRSTALAITYNVAVMLFGGFAQFIVSWLIKVTESPLVPAYYVMLGMSVSLLALFYLPLGNQFNMNKENVLHEHA